MCRQRHSKPSRRDPRTWQAKRLTWPSTGHAWKTHPGRRSSAGPRSIQRRPVHVPHRLRSKTRGASETTPLGEASVEPPPVLAHRIPDTAAHTRPHNLTWHDGAQSSGHAPTRTARTSTWHIHPRHGGRKAPLAHLLQLRGIFRCKSFVFNAGSRKCAKVWCQ